MLDSEVEAEFMPVAWEWLGWLSISDIDAEVERDAAAAAAAAADDGVSFGERGRFCGIVTWI